MLAELGTPEERAHLDGCAACGARYRVVQADVQAFARALAVGDPPAVRAARRAWRWPVAAALATAAAAALLWVTVGVRAPARDEARQGQAAVALAEISSALFSVEGDPVRIASDGPAGSPEADASSACGEWWHDDGLCGTTLGVLTGVFDPMAPGASDSPDLGDDS